MPRKRLSSPSQVQSLARLNANLLSEHEQELVLKLAAQRLGRIFTFTTTEQLLTTPEGMGLIKATPLQRGVCRIIDGLPLDDLAQCVDIAEALGFSLVELAEWEAARLADLRLPKEVLIIAAVRSAKSMIAAAKGIMATQSVDLAGLTPGEIPRFTLQSLTLDNAKVTNGHLVAALQQPSLQHLRISASEVSGRWKEAIEESGADLVSSEFVWHPSGRPIEIRVIAGKRGGGSAISRWSAGHVIDEAPRMIGASEGVVNWDDARRAVLSRLRPGAQLISVGSPWAPKGPIFDIVQNECGQPRKGRIVIKARGPAMNPTWWTAERCAELKDADPIAYQTDVMADFADMGETMFPAVVLNACTRADCPIIPYEPGHEYIAAIDPATRGNAWTLVVADKVLRAAPLAASGTKVIKRVVFATQWLGTPIDPLVPQRVLEDIASMLGKYHLSWFYTDQWAADFIKNLAPMVGLNAVPESWNASLKANAFLGLEAAFAQGEIEIPNDPVLHKDLRLARKQANRAGVAIHLSRTEDGMPDPFLQQERILDASGRRWTRGRRAHGNRLEFYR